MFPMEWAGAAYGFWRGEGMAGFWKRREEVGGEGTDVRTRTCCSPSSSPGALRSVDESVSLSPVCVASQHPLSF